MRMTESVTTEPLHELLSSQQDLARDVAALRSAFSDFIDEIRGRTKPLLTVDEVARQTGRSAYTVRTWIANGLISAVRVDGTGPRGRLLIPRTELDRVVRAGRGGDVVGPAVAEATK